MKLVSSKNIQKIFLTTNTMVHELTTKVDLIVSPEFYWVRKFEIPVKTTTQARHVLPTLFEDIIEETATLTYQVIKLEENQFLCFAFSNRKIYEAIKKSNIPISNISSLYFAQNECKGFNSFEVDKEKFMYTSDGILIKVPANLLDETISLNKVLNNIKLSSHKLQIKLYNDVLNTKVYYTLFGIFIVLTLMNIFKYFSYSFEIDKVKENIKELKLQNSLPLSMIQTNAIVNKYNKTIDKQKSKREAIAYILSNKKLNLKSINYTKNVLYLEYLSANKNEVENFLSKRYKVLSTNANSFSLKVSIKI